MQDKLTEESSNPNGEAMLSSEWVFAVDDEKLRENVLTVVFPKGLSVLLLKMSGQVHAIANKCAHMACELASGDLDGYIIKCPCHDWRFDIRTGEFLDAKEIRILTYETKVSDGKVLLRIGGRI